MQVMCVRTPYHSRRTQGNGIAVCGDESAPNTTSSGHVLSVRSTIRVVRLDNIVPPHVQEKLKMPVMKMDTEAGGVAGACVCVGGRRRVGSGEGRSVESIDIGEPWGVASIHGPHQLSCSRLLSQGARWQGQGRAAG